MKTKRAGDQIDLAGYTYFIGWVMTWVVDDSRKSTTRCHTKLQPAAQVRHFNMLTAGRTISARKAHLSMTLEGGVRRGVGPRLLVLMVRLLVLWYFGALIHWVQVSIPPLTIHSTILVAHSSPNPLSWDQMRRTIFCALGLNLLSMTYCNPCIETKLIN